MKPPKPTTGPVRLLLGTMKGAFIATSDKDRKDWTLSDPIMLGHIINHAVADPRDPKLILLGGRTGHLGPTLYRSTDGGKSFTEAKKPPRFPVAKEGEAPGRSVKANFWLTPCHANEPHCWYAATIPYGLFRSEDDGDTWKEVKGFSKVPVLAEMEANGGTPGGPITHSPLVDPRDPNHLYVSTSGGGTYETTDGGKKWKYLNKGVAMDFAPPGDYDYGHDPHCVQMSKTDPDRLYQQNHCGIYRLDRPGAVWERIGDHMPREVGDIGFPIAIHPRDPDTLWVVPMDGSSVWPRTSPGGKPAVYTSTNGGRKWSRRDSGLPKSNSHLTIYRQGLTLDSHDPVGVYFGTSSGEVWASSDEGKKWRCIARSLPSIIAVEAG